MGRQPVGTDELVEHWTVLEDELELVAGKRGPTRLGFALLLKFYTRHGRIPRGRAEFADEVVDHVARQVKVSASELGLYDWTGRTIEYHRAQIRDHLGFRVCGVVDAEKMGVVGDSQIAGAVRGISRRFARRGVRLRSGSRPEGRLSCSHRARCRCLWRCGLRRSG